MPNPKEILAMLNKALKELSQPGLSEQDIKRLMSVIKAARAYHGLFREYLKYQKIMGYANRK